MKVFWEKRAQHKYLFYKYFFSFLVFLLIPIFSFTIIIYFGILQYSEEKVQNVNMAKLQLVENNIDTVFANARISAFSLIQEEKIKKLFDLDCKDLVRNFNNVRKVMDAYDVFDNTIYNNSSIRSIYIYDTKNDIIICSYKGLFKRTDFYDIDWIEPYRNNIINKSSITALRNLSDKSYQSKKDEVITYIIPLNYMQTDGLIAINIAASSFSKNFISTSKNDEESYIAIDENANIIYEQDNRIKDTEGIVPKVISEVTGRTSDRNGSYFFNDNDKKFLVMFRRSSISGLTIIDVMLLNSVFDKIFFYKWLIAMSIVMMSIIGVVLSYLLSKKLYNPVRQVLDNLKNQIMFDPRYKRNELLIISDAINNLVENSKKADKIIETNRQNLKESYIMGLVMGKTDENDEYVFLDDYCCCILISIDKYDLFSTKYSYREQYYYKSLILKVGNQVVSLYAKGGGAILETDKIVLVVSVENNILNGFNQTIATICDRIISEISAIKNFSISLGVGSIYNNKESIRKSFLEASKAMKYRLLFGYSSVIYYNEISDFSNVWDYPFEQENHIMNNLRLNSSQEISDSIEKIIDQFKCFKTKKVNCEIVMQFVNKLVSKTMEYLESSYINAADIFGKNYNVYYEFTGKETLNDLKQWLDYFYERIISYQKLYVQNADENKHFKDIINIINTTYMDSDLCIESISDKLNLSYSHVRKIFKNFSGVNFVDYLNKMRIENAKELLLKTNYTIKDIAIKSGYNNDQSLTRFFKRYEGVTPGRYRTNWIGTRREE